MQTDDGENRNVRVEEITDLGASGLYKVRLRKYSTGAVSETSWEEQIWPGRGELVLTAPADVDTIDETEETFGGDRRTFGEDRR